MVQKTELDNIVIRISRSDRAALDELYRMFYPLLVNYASLMVSRETAKDIVHDVFLRLWLGREGLLPELSLTGGGNIRSFLLRSTYNASISVIRKQLSKLNHRKMLKNDIEEYYRIYDVDRSDIIRKLYSSDIRTYLDDAISRLPPKCREVFLLSYVENLSAKEISARLSISTSTVENQIHTALIRLRSSLKNIRDSESKA